MGDECPCERQSLDLAGLKYSPGGDQLPHPCQPFHPTLNNPYAVRCVDAWPWYATGFPGDEHCILPPQPGKGIQVGVHPQGRSWHAEVSGGDMGGYAPDRLPPEFLVHAGERQEDHYHSGTRHAEDRHFYRHHLRLRTGAHFAVAYSHPGVEYAVQDRWGAHGEGQPPEPSFLLGTGRSTEDVPRSLRRPPEDEGLYRVLARGSGVDFHIDHFNYGTAAVLREAWLNLWWTDTSDTEIQPLFGFEIEQVAAAGPLPGETADRHASVTLDAEARLLTLVPQRHVWTRTFSAWLVRPGGAMEVLYQSFDWRNVPLYSFDSLTDNPKPDPEQRLDGASSGVHILRPGDELHLNCHIDFTAERAEAEGAPSPESIGPLRHAVATFRGRHCALLGTVAAGAPVLGFRPDDGPVPAFAR